MLAFLYSRKLSFITLFIFLLPAPLLAQNLFLEKIDVCSTASFCMDCGDPKATCDQFTLDYICDQINRKYILKDAYGSISFQVLVEPSGFSCVLSHTDVTNGPLTAELIRYLNGNIWRPAKENGKPVYASVNVIFRFANGKISSQMQRMDLTELKPPGDPAIYNKTTTYSNPSLKSYEFTTWTKYNSPLPDNISKSCIVDKSDVLWYTTIKGLTRFDGQNFNPVNEFNSPFTAETVVADINVDKDNNKWVYVDDKPRTWFYDQGVLQIPASVSPLIRFPLFWLSFHNLSLSVIKWMSSAAYRKDGYLNLYFHPWEFTNLHNKEKYGLPGYISKNSGEPFILRIKSFIAWAQSKGYEFSRTNDFASGVMKKQTVTKELTSV